MRQRVQDHTAANLENCTRIEEIRADQIPVEDNQELTENCRLAASLERAAARFHTLAETVGDAVITVNAGGWMVAFSKGAEQMFGCGAELMLNRNVSVLVPEFGPFAEEIRHDRLLHPGRRRSECRSLEATAIRQDGSRFPVELRVSELESDGEPLFVGVIRDLTARKGEYAKLLQLEQHNRAILHALPDELFRIRRDGVILDYLPSRTRSIVEDPDSVIGNTVRLVVPSHMVTRLMEGVTAALKQGGLQRLETLVIRGSDKLEFELRIIASGVDEVLVIAADITQRKDAERQLRLYYREVTESRRRIERQAEDLEKALAIAQAATEAKSAFLATMSHEIRTPMNAVIGMTELLGETSLSAEQSEYLDAIRTSGQLLLGIINDILDLSKIEAGMVSFEPRVFDLPSAVQETADLLAVKTQEKNLRLLVHLAPDLPRMVIGDEGRIRQILINLLGNAIKFTDQGYVMVEVGCASFAAGEVTCRIRVKDTGIGIPEDRLHLLFRDFSQADSSTTRKYGGTGLGLAISKRLAHLMGGDIRVESAQGKGTTFEILLRMQVDSSSYNGQYCDLRLRGRTAIVAHPHEECGNLLVEELAAAGLSCMRMSSASDALRMLEETESDYVFVDEDLPLAEQIALLSRNLPQTRYLLLTSRYRAGAAERWQQAGYHAYLPQVLQPAALQEALLQVSEVRPGEIVNRHSLRQVPVDSGSFQESFTDSMRHLALRVLVAEDNNVNQKLMTRLLQKLGCIVDIAPNGQEAVRMWQSLTYDLLLMDCQMPVMDGYDAAREIRKQEGNGPHTPVIAVTADAVDSNQDLCREAGMDAFLLKPINLDQLKRTLVNWGCHAKAASARPVS